MWTKIKADHKLGKKIKKHKDPFCHSCYFFIISFRQKNSKLNKIGNIAKNKVVL